MKTLKLEVGKTYRSRKGEEVKIVENDGKGGYPCRGDNGKWYTESGRYEFSTEGPEDLIEELPETQHTFALVAEALTGRYTFAIPDGMTKLTVEQVSNRIIVEMVPEDKDPEPVDVKFKEGDIVFEDGRIMIIKKHPNLYRALIHGSPDYLHVDGSYGVPFTSAAFRLATAEEAQLLFDALKKTGKRWNAEAMQIEEIGPKTGDVLVNEWGSVYIFKEVRRESHEYFACLGRDGRVYYHSVVIPGRPATPEEVQPLWDALKKAGKRWNPETMQVEGIPEKEQIEKFLKDYTDGVVWSRCQLLSLIESYLRYREGENCTCLNKISTGLTYEQRKKMREDAIAIETLAIPCAGSQDNTFKCMMDMVHAVLVLTNDVSLNSECE